MCNIDLYISQFIEVVSWLVYRSTLLPSTVIGALSMVLNGARVQSFSLLYFFTLCDDSAYVIHSYDSEWEFRLLPLIPFFACLISFHLHHDLVRSPNLNSMTKDWISTGSSGSSRIQQHQFLKHTISMSLRNFSCF